MTWKIVTDSSCDWAPESPACAVSSVPFIISAGHEDFVDDAALQVPAMLDAMERCDMASHTSCPTPQAWLEEFEQADRCIAIAISSRLSGSMNSAQIACELALERAPEIKQDYYTVLSEPESFGRAVRLLEEDDILRQLVR